MAARGYALLAVGFTLVAPSAFAQNLQIAPLASYRSGGSFSLPSSGLIVRPKSGFAYGGTVDLAIKPTWRVELAYSRQETNVDGGFGRRLGITLENYFVGLQEERGAEENAKSRPFGTLLLGATRFVPDFPADAETFPAAGFALGMKLFPAKNFGLRFEGRGIMTFVTTNGGSLCGNGTCYLNSSGSSFWQWEFSGGAIIAF